jgi:hypothetical protein
MQHALSFLLGLVLLGLGCSAAQAQTTPVPKTQPAKASSRTEGATAKKRPAAHSFIKDTAAFRRSGRPVDKVPVRPQPKL